MLQLEKSLYILSRNLGEGLTRLPLHKHRSLLQLEIAHGCNRRKLAKIVRRNFGELEAAVLYIVENALHVVSAESPGNRGRLCGDVAVAGIFHAGAQRTAGQAHAERLAVVILLEQTHHLAADMFREFPVYHASL